MSDEHATAISCSSALISFCAGTLVDLAKREAAWQSCWQLGIRLGTSEESNEHLLPVEWKLLKTRSIRRLSDDEVLIWDVEGLRLLSISLWNPLADRPPDQPRRVHPKPIGIRAVLRATSAGLQHAVRGDTQGLKRPLTQGCLACQNRGSPVGGY